MTSDSDGTRTWAPACCASCLHPVRSAGPATSRRDHPTPTDEPQRAHLPCRACDTGALGCESCRRLLTLGSGLWALLTLLPGSPSETRDSPPLQPRGQPEGGHRNQAQAP